VRFADLAEILRRELGPDLGARACRAICEHAAGESVYIPGRPEPPEILPSDTPRTVAARYRINRETARNWVNRWRG
jgi:hypothetical protein